jgi:hypothetical protein
MEEWIYGVGGVIIFFLIRGWMKSSEEADEDAKKRIRSLIELIQKRAGSWYVSNICDNWEVVLKACDAAFINKELAITVGESTIKERESAVGILRAKCYRLEKCIEEKDELYQNLMSGTESDLLKIVSLLNDHEFLQFSISEKWLETKPHPSYKESERIGELRVKASSYFERYKIMWYKYEFLLNLFPELSSYVDDISEINKLVSFDGINDVRENYDRSRDFLSKDEYDSLSMDVKNQLALDRYVSGKKTNWQIGRDYEMFCAHIFIREGHKVEMHGIEKKLEDLGRDLIVYTNYGILIVQCKYWAQNKEIHEKHIAQLYGSAMEYSISNASSLAHKDVVIPVFMTNIKLSETAMRFADKLGVIVRIVPMGEFPRIKCNISVDGEKIYHLPFDQQYDRTKIEPEKGEFFVFTVKEAMEKEFRRARRYYFNS